MDETRVCTKCHKEQPITEYYLDSYKLWRRRDCKTCVRSEARKRMNKNYQNDPEKYKARAVKYRSDRKAQGVKEKPRSRPEEYFAKKSKYDKQYRIDERIKAFTAYGGVFCKCCNETNQKFLTIDHINNDGAKERKSVNRNGGYTFYRYLRKNNYPPGYQVLCYNCNIARHHNGGICPHNE